MSTLNPSSETMQNLARSPRQNLFTLKDRSIVREGLAKLQAVEQEIVALRFWENNTITEIASILDLSWQEVEAHLKQALVKLQEYCLNHKKFSRAKSSGGQECLKQNSLSKPTASSKKVA